MQRPQQHRLLRTSWHLLAAAALIAGCMGMHMVKPIAQMPQSRIFEHFGVRLAALASSDPDTRRTKLYAFGRLICFAGQFDRITPFISNRVTNEALCRSSHRLT
jgi:hypothetical protein